VHAGAELLIALNTVHQPRKLDWTGEATLLLSTYLDGEGAPRKAPIQLRPDEGVVLKLAA
jgi:hypothetical protein